MPIKCPICKGTGNVSCLLCDGKGSVPTLPPSHYTAWTAILRVIANDPEALFTIIGTVKKFLGWR